MPSLPRSSRSRSASIRSCRASYQDVAQQRCYRDAAQQTSQSRSSSRSASPHNGHHPTRSPHARPSATHLNRKRFGMNVYDNQTRIGEFDFEKIYPEDPIYEELGPNARAWRVNLDECEVFDNDMVIEARDGLDLLLVFAGLFSAVLTTFVAQTSQALSNNFPAISTSLLLEMVSLQRAFINGNSIDDISSSEMTSGPSGFDVWVNALWFTSLALSLGTALMAVLVKQWLYQYMSIVSGTARDRSLIRFYRFDGLRKWHVLTIIGTLPIVLHIALGLFLAGLVVFLIPLNIPLASVVGFITIVIYTMYTVSNILPIIYTQCPYRTPFSDILNILMRPIFTLVSFILSSAAAQALHTFFTSTTGSVARLYKICFTRIFKYFSRLKKASSHPSTFPKVVFPTLKDAERIAATSDEAAEGIAADALVWLHQMTSNTPTKSIVLQSLGCLSDDVSNRLIAVNTDLEKALEGVIHQHMFANGLYYCSIRPSQERHAERLLRAQRHIKESRWDRSRWKADADAFKPPFHILAAILTYAPAKSVESRGGEPRDWDSKDLVMHIIQEYSAGRPIHLPSTLWQRFMPITNQTLEDTNLVLPLCQLALDSWDNTERTPPFSGGVLITHDTVLMHLKHVIPSILAQNDLPDSEPLRQLYIINDYIVSELSTNRNLVTADAISTLMDIWNRFPPPIDGTSEAVCRRAEKCMLEVFVGDWWDGLSYTDVLIRCYSSVVYRYQWYCGPDSVPGVKLFMKLFSELCWSSVVAEMTGYGICPILELPFSLDVESTTTYYTLLCGPESPLFSPRTKLTLEVSTNICRVIASFVRGLARGSHPPPLTHQCMEFFCEEPDRLFSLCRVLALRYLPDDDEEENIKADLVKLVRLDPYRAAWEDRKHYLIDIEPLDWPYFVIPKDHEHIGDAQDRMQFALKVLDDFFASPSEVCLHLGSDPQHRPPTSPPSGRQTRPIIGESYMDWQPEPPTVVSPWRRVCQPVSSTRAFRRLSSSPVDIPLADRPSRMSASELRHTLATIEPANATAGPSFSHIAPGGDDSMV